MNASSARMCKGLSGETARNGVKRNKRKLSYEWCQAYKTCHQNVLWVLVLRVNN